MKMVNTCTGSRGKNPAKFSDTCSVKANGLCIGCVGQWAERGREKFKHAGVFSYDPVQHSQRSIWYQTNELGESFRYMPPGLPWMPRGRDDRVVACWRTHSILIKHRCLSDTPTNSSLESLLHSARYSYIPILCFLDWPKTTISKYNRIAVVCCTNIAGPIIDFFRLHLVDLKYVWHFLRKMCWGVIRVDTNIPTTT